MSDTPCTRASRTGGSPDFWKTQGSQGMDSARKWGHLVLISNRPLVSFQHPVTLWTRFFCTHRNQIRAVQRVSKKMNLRSFDSYWKRHFPLKILKYSVTVGVPKLWTELSQFLKYWRKNDCLIFFFWSLIRTGYILDRNNSKPQVFFSKVQLIDFPLCTAGAWVLHFLIFDTSGISGGL